MLLRQKRVKLDYIPGIHLNFLPQFTAACKVQITMFISLLLSLSCKAPVAEVGVAAVLASGKGTQMGQLIQTGHRNIP